MDRRKSPQMVQIPLVSRRKNPQAVRKWFGIGGRCSIPSRENVLKIALATKMSVQETTEYLQYGISQPGLQENDYREFIIMYCLEHQYGLEKCQR